MIRLTLLLFTGIVFLLNACTKDTSKTRPQIKIDSYNTKEVKRLQDLVILLDFTDNDGDLPGGNFVYMPRRLNRRPPPPGVRYPDSVKLTVPKFPDSKNGAFELRLNWNILSLGGTENDTLFFRFVVVDKAGNRSDTVDSDRIVVLRQ